ncbi:MAG: hypothetical protein Q4C13_03050, partial [Clostridia bacterium]|nr:hypothetical protein [Clostridia bacterium]
PPLPAPDRLALRVLVGVKDEPALAAMLAGLLGAAARAALAALLPEDWPETPAFSAEAWSGGDAFSLEAAGMITLTPAQIIRMVLETKKRGA